MKKILLVMLAIIATMGASAGEWSKNFYPTADRDENGSVRTAVAPDGSVYVSSATWWGIEGIINIDTPLNEDYSSTVVVKYDKDGTVLWGAIFNGHNSIEAMTTDTDGNLYVAGCARGIRTSIKGTVSGDEKDVINPTVYYENLKCYQPIACSGYVAKFTPAGGLVDVKSITPADNPEFTESTEYEYMFLGDTIAVIPENIKVYGDKVYVSARYYGDVEELGWKGAYTLADGFMYFDAWSMGVFSMNKDLTGVKSEYNIQATGSISEVLTEPEALNFSYNDGKLCVAAFGFGNLTITTPSGTQDITGLVYDQNGDGIEHAFILTKLGSALEVKEFKTNAPIKDEPLDFFTIDNGIKVVDGNLILAGNFYGSLPLNTELVASTKSGYVASVKLEDNTVNWAQMAEEQVAVSVVDNELLNVAGETNGYAYALSNGDLSKTSAVPGIIQDADINYKGENAIVYFSSEDIYEPIVYVTAKTIPYSTSINIEQLVLDNGVKYDIAEAFADSYIEYASINALDSLNDAEGKFQRNEPFLGLKLKTAGAYIKVAVKKGSTLKVKFGNIGDNIKVNATGTDLADIAKKTTKDSGYETTVYEYTATDADAILTFTTSSKETVVLKQIMIDENIAEVILPWGIETATPENGTVAVPKSANPNDVVTITATPSEGYELDAITVTGKNSDNAYTVSAENTFTMPEENVSVTVTFKQATGINGISADDTANSAVPVKVIKDGKLYIGKYNVAGQRVK